MFPWKVTLKGNGQWIMMEYVVDFCFAWHHADKNVQHVAYTKM